MTTPRPEDVPGWFSPDEGAWYADLARALAPGGVLVEVGCWKGRSTAWVGPACRARGVRLVCVDAWAGSQDEYHDAYAAALAREDVRASFDDTLRAFGVQADVLAMDSRAAAATLPAGSIDLVFLDASHDAASVRADLAAWWPRVREGGALAGHDLPEPGVHTEVERHARAHGVVVERGPGTTFLLRR